MSYVPYTPDVCPPLDAPPPSRSRRVFLWAGGSLLYLSLIAAWVWWMKLPPKIQPPLSMIPLPDGTELRLVNVREGSEYRAYSTDTFNDRIRVNQAAYYQSSTNSRSGRGTWLVYSQFHPRTERFWAPQFDSFEVTEPGNSFVYPAYMDSSPDRTLVHDILLLPVIPRRSPTLHVKLRTATTGSLIEADIPNPVYRPGAPIWKGESLPVHKVVDGITVAVEKITFGTTQRSVNGKTRKYPAAYPSIKVTAPGMPKDSFGEAYEWSDATGNIIDSGILPHSESVWKLKVTFTESANYPFPPKQVFSLGTIKVPGPGQVVTLTVPKELRNRGVTDALVMGPGSYRRNGTMIALIGANGQPSATVANTTGFSPSSLGTINTWEIHLYSQASGGMRGRGQTLRVHHASGVIDASSTGSSSNGYASTDTWGNYRSKSGPVPAGDNITIDMVIPKTRTTEFLINRPELPSK